MSAIRFTKDHEWVRQEGDVAVIGITDYAQSQLGDVVYVELPEIGRTVATAEPETAEHLNSPNNQRYTPAAIIRVA